LTTKVAARRWAAEVTAGGLPAEVAAWGLTAEVAAAGLGAAAAGRANLSAGDADAQREHAHQQDKKADPVAHQSFGAIHRRVLHGWMVAEII
jgi:hypothetical protein